MGLFGIIGELQSVVCKQDKSRAGPRMARENEHFYRAEKEGGRAVVNRVHGFSESVFARKEEDSCFFLLGSAIVAGHEMSSFWSLNYN